MVRRESISSAQNPKIKHLLALQEKSRLRKEEGLFVVEGVREVARALDAGYQAATLFVCPEIFNVGEGPEHAALAKLIDEASTFDRPDILPPEYGNRRTPGRRGKPR